MGHSTVSFTKPGMLSTSEITKAVSEKQRESRSEYGHNEHPDSFAHVSDPEFNKLSKVYSQSAATALIDSIERYQTISLYYIPDRVWNTHFSSINKPVKALEKKIAAVRKKLSTLNEKNKPKVSEATVFVTCGGCSSKINLTKISTYQMPSRCPVCYNEEFKDLAATKLLGKSFVNKKNKLKAEWDALETQLKELSATRVSSVSVSQLDPKLKGYVKTVVAGDIHH